MPDATCKNCQRQINLIMLLCVVVTVAVAAICPATARARDFTISIVERHVNPPTKWSLHVSMGLLDGRLPGPDILQKAHDKLVEKIIGRDVKVENWFLRFQLPDGTPFALWQWHKNTGKVTKEYFPANLKGDLAKQAEKYDQMNRPPAPPLKRIETVEFSTEPLPLLGIDSPKMYMPGTPAHAMALYLAAWGDGDTQAMAKVSQLCWLAKKGAADALANRVKGTKLLGTQITRVELKGPALAVATVRLRMRRQGDKEDEFKIATANLVKEVSPCKPGPAGSWGVNGNSTAGW